MLGGLKHPAASGYPGTWGICRRKSGSVWKNVICSEHFISSPGSRAVRAVNSHKSLESNCRGWAESSSTNVDFDDNGITKRRAIEMLEKKLTSSIHPPASATALLTSLIIALRSALVTALIRISGGTILASLLLLWRGTSAICIATD